MHISAFTVAGFGRLRPQAVDGLSPGLNIFLGANEAGKSTSLEFFRTMLCGYPDKRSKARRFPPLYGPAEGGVILLSDHELPGMAGPLGLSRSRNDAPALKGPDGETLDPSTLERLFSGVTRAMYHAVYGFSLKELQEFALLERDEVRHALYGASFGLGSRPPAQVIKELNDAMAALFTPRGKKNQASTARLARLAAIRDELRRHGQDAPRYDALQSRLGAAESELATLRAGLDAHTRALHRDERLLAAWEQWETLLRIEERLNAAELAITEFPPDALPRLERCLEQHAQAGIRLSQALARHGHIERDLTELSPDTALARILPQVRALAEQKASFRAARETMPALEAELERARAERDRALTVLGPDWSVERAAAFDRSLFTHEDISRHERALREGGEATSRALALAGRAQSEAENARDEAARLRREQEQAALSEAEQRLAGLAPETVEQVRSRRAAAAFASQALNAQNREIRRTEDELRAALHTVAPGWGSSLSDVESTDSGTAAQSTLPVGDSAPAFDPHRQNRALAAARTALDAAASADDALRALEADERRAKELNDRRERLAAALRTPAPSRAEVEEYGQALAALRRLPAERELARERLERSERELAALEAAPPRALVKAPLLVCGILAACFGLINAAPALLDASGLWPGPDALAALANNAPIFSALYEARLAAGSALAFGLVPLVAGLALLWLGRPRFAPGAQHQHKAHCAELCDARQQAAVALDALDAREADLKKILDAPKTGEYSLDAAEAALERARAGRGRREQLADSLAECEAECAAARNLEQIRRDALQNAQTGAEAARAAWRAELAALELPEGIDPAEAERLIDRVRAVPLLRGRLAAAREQAASHAVVIRQLADTLAALPGWNAPRDYAENPAGFAVSSDALPNVIHDALFDAADAWLASARRAGERALEHTRRQQAAQSALERAKRLEQAAKTAEAEHTQTIAHLQDTRDAWAFWLEQAGLDTALTPETARQALETMEHCLRLDGEVHSLEARRRALSADMHALSAPLAGLLKELGRPALAPQTDALTKLDQLLREAEQAHALEVRREQLRRDLTEAADATERERLAEQESAQALKVLLDSGNSPDEDAFRRAAALFAEREALLRRRDDVRITLRLAAQTETAGEALDLFRRVDAPALEAKIAEARSTLAEQRQQETALVDETAGLRAELTALPGRDDAARLRLEQAGLEEDLRREAREWARLALTRHIIDTAKRRFEKERQPGVVRRAGTLFADMTGNRWTGLSASLDDANFSVLGPDGLSLPNAELSRGAQEQLYLALRLAYLEDHALRGHPLPLILDDILVNFDPERAARTADVLARMAAPNDDSPAHQVLFFTCHPATADLLHNSAPEAPRFALEDGRFVRR